MRHQFGRVCALSFMLLSLASFAFAQSGDRVSLSATADAAKEEGIKWVLFPGDGNILLNQEGTQYGFRTDPDNAQHMLYCDVDDTFIKDGQPTREVWVSIEYLDSGVDTLTLQYDSGPDGIAAAFKDAGVITKGGTGLFRTAIYHLTDASFANREQSVADFRIDDRGDGAEFITKVIVSKTALSLPNAATVTGTIRASAAGGGAPVAKARVVASNGATAVTNDQGVYTLSFQEGTYTLQVVRPGFLKVDPKSVTVKPNGSAAVDFTLEPFGKDTVTLSAKDGVAVVDGLSRVFVEGNTDGFGQVETISGKEALRTGPDTEPYPDSFLYGNVDDNFLFQGEPTTEVYVTMEYLDQGTAGFGINYDSTGNPWAAGANGTRTNTGTWKTFTWHLTDAYFGNQEQSVGDFRISDGGGGDVNDLYISKVTVSTKMPSNFGVLSGKVANATGGAAIPSVTVTADTGERVVTNAQGLFSLPLPEGAHTLTVSGSGIETTTAKDIAVAAGKTTDLLTIPVKTTAVVTSVSISVKNGAVVSEGIKWVQNAEGTDGYGTIEDYQGKGVIRTGPTIEPANDIFLYLNVDDTFLLNGNPTREAWVTMEYWDGGTAAFT
ncbi:MAG TPA: carboxypeptidase-like regulatory domain-containing protein, partial [Armatimonadota bacterium]